jgi:hypothetical protein
MLGAATDSLARSPQLVMTPQVGADEPEPAGTVGRRCPGGRAATAGPGVPAGRATCEAGR